MLTLLLTIIGMFSKKLRKLYLNLLSSYMNEKYKNWCFCEASVEDKSVVFSFASAKCSYHVTACHDPTSFCIVARSHIGNHILMLNGLKKPDEIPVVKLISKLSFVRSLGLTGWLLFKREWKGNSTIRMDSSAKTIVVVKYL